MIAADDRTGALEVAGMCAVDGSASVVTTVPRATGPRVLTVDLGTRHLAAAEAAARATQLERHVLSAEPAPRHGHKIDSLLRGNWAVELLARRLVAGRRIVVVPAFPALGRTCSGGVVRAHGVPVNELDDARGEARTSRPAGELDAEEVDVTTLDGWLRRADAVAVCDAASDADLQRIAALLDAHPDVLVAGPAGALAAAAHGAPARHPLPLPRPALVVCGSLHPLARRQLVAAGRIAGVAVLASDHEARHGEASAVAEALAAEARAALDGIATLVIIGGDTAAAMLGPDDVTVGGTVAAGMPWCPRVLDRDVQLVTKAGAFGDEGTIARLFGVG